MTDSLLQKLQFDPLCAAAIADGRITWEEKVSLKNLTSFRTGGTAPLVLFPSDEQACRDLIRALRGESAVILGNGSNLLAPDEDLRVPLISTLKMKKIRFRGESVYAEAGASLTKLSFEAQKKALTGMEFLYGIPGSVGGAAVMNAGAYDHEMKEIVLGVTVCDPEGNPCVLSAEEADFSYRRSRFSHSGEVVLGVEFALKKGDPDEIRAKMEELMERRRSKQPLEYPSAGSYFKRPAGYFAGKLIEDCGLKGYAVGGAQVSEKHAGFVINAGGASTRDVLELEEEIRRRVKEKFGVTLEREVQKLSPEGEKS